jgi:hypothetical protein
MPSDRNNSPGTLPVSSAGFLPPKTAGEIDLFSRLPSPQETRSLLAGAAALQEELFRGLPSPAENDRLLREAFASQQEQMQQIVAAADLITDEPPPEDVQG